MYYTVCITIFIVVDYNFIVRRQVGCQMQQINELAFHHSFISFVQVMDALMFSLVLQGSSPQRCIKIWLLVNRNWMSHSTDSVIWITPLCVGFHLLNHLCFNSPFCVILLCIKHLWSSLSITSINGHEYLLLHCYYNHY